MRALEPGTRGEGPTPWAGELCPAAEAPVRVCFLIDELGGGGAPRRRLLALIRHLDRRPGGGRTCLGLLRGNRPGGRGRWGAGRLPRPAPGRRVAAPAAQPCSRRLRFGRFLRRERIEVLQVYFPDQQLLRACRRPGWAGVPYRLCTRNNVGHWADAAAPRHWGGC